MKITDLIGFGMWLGIGLVLYFTFARKRSNLHPGNMPAAELAASKEEE